MYKKLKYYLLNLTIVIKYNYLREASMNIIDIIDKKRDGLSLSYDELDYAFSGYKRNEIEDYQMSSLLMAICINGMSDEEVYDLTDIFVKSGNVLDLSKIEGIKVDKHSTGGIGDKTTLIVTPIVASLGIKVAKMSGRGLGITGGTIDKLESIPSFKTALTTDEFIKEVNDIGMCVCSQTEDLVPLDKVVYALRDVTATSRSIPLIAVSVMSKKIATGADKILIDIKTGRGALLRTKEEAYNLRDLMIRIGSRYGKEVKCIISNMDIPLGYCVGNSLEVAEAIEILSGNIKNNLYDLCVEIASNMVSMATGESLVSSSSKVINAINDKSAYNKFMEFVKYQGGNIEKMKVSNEKIEIKSIKDGTIKNIDALKIGEVSCMLGAGKMKKDDVINHEVGVFINKKIGDKVKEGDVLCTLYVGNVKEDFDVISAFDIR